MRRLVCFAMILVPAPAAAAPDVAPSVLVTTTTLRAGSVPRIVTAYGSVQADSAARNTLVAPLAATVGSLNVRVGQAVTQGAALAVLVPTPQTRSAYAQTASTYQAAAATLTRTRALLDERLATRQQLADAEKALSDAQDALAALRAQGADAATALRAPFRGIVTALDTSVRAIVTEGTPLLELAPADGLVLRVGVVPDQAAAINAGDSVTITPLTGTAAFSGKVVLRGSVVEADGLVPVQISLPPGALLPGQTAEAAITTAMVHGYVVPHQAVLVDDSGSAYIVQLVHMAARIVSVRVTAAAGDQDVIEGRVDASAPLVLSGNYQLQDGMKVRLSDSAASHDR